MLPACTPNWVTILGAGPGGNGRLLFDDEFNGPGLDLSKWRPNWLGASDRAITKPVNGAESSCYDPAQVGVGGGFLHLTAVRRRCRASDGATYRYASGLVETFGKFSFTYGHIEAGICVPGSGAIDDWPAFWADGTGTWPATGELDVMEGLAGRAAGHFHSRAGGPGVAAVSRVGGAGCHVYAADWEPGSVTYEYDGTTIGTIRRGITSSPMFLILNLGVGGYGGRIRTPATMLVDYVRVWRR